MKKTSTLKKISLTITLFTGCALCAVAQNSTTAPVVTYQIAEVTSPSIDPDTKAIEQYKSYPWFNYKGVTNIEEAKKLWMQDNPTTHKKTDATPAVPAKEKSKKNFQ